MSSVPHKHENGAWGIAQLSGRGDIGDLITGGCDGNLRMWNFSTAKQRTESEDGNEDKHLLRPVGDKMMRHSLPVVAVSVSKEKDIALSTSLDGALKISTLSSNMADAKNVQHPSSQSNVFDAWCVAAPHTGETAIIGGANGSLHAIDVDVGICDRSFTVLPSSDGDKTDPTKMPMVMSVCLSADDSRVVAGTSDGRVVELDVEAGSVVSKLDDSTIANGKGAPVRSVSYVVGDRNSVVVARDNGLVSVVDISSGDTTAVLRGHTGMVFTAQASLNGRYIASGGADTHVKVWDRTERNLIFNSTTHTQPVWSVAWSSGDSHVVSVGDDNVIGILQCHGKE